MTDTATQPLWSSMAERDQCLDDLRARVLRFADAAYKLRSVAHDLPNMLDQSPPWLEETLDEIARELAPLDTEMRRVIEGLYPQQLRSEIARLERELEGLKQREQKHRDRAGKRLKGRRAVGPESDVERQRHDEYERLLADADRSIRNLKRVAK